MTEKIRQLQREFASLEDQFLRYSYLAELGALLPPMNKAFKTDEHLFRGCQSRIWLHLSLTEGRLDIQGGSDAVIMRGILALLREICQGEQPQTVAATPFDVLSVAGVSRQFSSSRSHGVASLTQAIRDFCAHDTSKT